MKVFRATCDSPLGLLELVASNKGLREINFGAGIFKPNWNDILRDTASQLKEYFRGTRKEFQVPLDMEGTEFQKSVWKALRKVPFGKSASYGDLARAIGKPGAARAIGQANRKNPVPIIVPCHRVIGSTGKLTGYAGGLDIKRKLLEHEHIQFKN